ncbi:chloride channel protein [Georgfuchsia toluolica]|uniref:chloride channel protein n=1 Tax=Georgfuchsia toluolica TaxID=424218 RepID=UPI001C738988|nr:chloride channel protein [Georgfuchsia toluolica]
MLAGLAVVAFAKLADIALTVFFTLTSSRPWLPFLLTPAIGMVVVWLTRRFVPGAQGSGIPQVIAATRLAALGQPVSSLVSLRIAFGKICLGALALVGGFSAGREGPSVQVAASIMHAAHRFLPHTRALRVQDLVLAGGAAGIAAAFNTPLAGIVFAVEELGRRLEARTSGVLVSTIILAGLASMALLGNYNYFGHLKVESLDRAIIIPVILGGAVCGLLGGAFSWLLLLPQKSKGFVLWRWRDRHPVWFAGVCGIAVALIGWIGGGISFGSGYSITSHVVSGQQVLPWHAAITRFLATAISYYSGIPGGIFAPSLAVGAALASNMAHVLGTTADTAPLIALCMAGFLAAVTQSPITSAIIVMEMVDGHEMVISLMAITLISKAVSSRITPELYQQLALGFRSEQKNRG